MHILSVKIQMRNPSDMNISSMLLKHMLNYVIPVSKGKATNITNGAHVDRFTELSSEL